MVPFLSLQRISTTFSLGNVKVNNDDNGIQFFRFGCFADDENKSENKDRNIHDEFFLAKVVCPTLFNHCRVLGKYRG